MKEEKKYDSKKEREEAAFVMLKEGKRISLCTLVSKCGFGYSESCGFMVSLLKDKIIGDDGEGFFSLRTDAEAFRDYAARRLKDIEDTEQVAKPSEEVCDDVSVMHRDYEQKLQEIFSVFDDTDDEDESNENELPEDTKETETFKVIFRTPKGLSIETNIENDETPEDAVDNLLFSADIGRLKGMFREMEDVVDFVCVERRLDYTKSTFTYNGENLDWKKAFGEQVKDLCDGCEFTVELLLEEKKNC